jgi:predicted CoA-binding protein
MKTVAVVGASSHRYKFGNQAVLSFLRQGYTVFPINRHEDEIEGLKAYRSVLDVPGPIDMVSIYVPPTEGLDVLVEVAAKQICEVWLNPGAESPAVLQRARDLGIEPIVACSLIALGTTL